MINKLSKAGLVLLCITAVIMFKVEMPSTEEAAMAVGLYVCSAALAYVCGVADTIDYFNSAEKDKKIDKKANRRAR